MKYDKVYEEFKDKHVGEADEVDYYRFELGYNIAFNMIIYLTVFLYALISPIITLIGALYFTIKYYVDKYNLTVVYPKNYDSKGQLSQRIRPLAYFSIYFIQLLMYILFTLTLKQDSFSVAIIVFGIFQVIITLIFKLKFSVAMEWFRSWGNYMTEEEEMKLGYDQGLMDEDEYVEYEKQLSLKKTEDIFTNGDMIGTLFKQKLGMDMKKNVSIDTDIRASMVYDAYKKMNKDELEDSTRRARKISKAQTHIIDEQ